MVQGSKDPGAPASKGPRVQVARVQIGSFVPSPAQGSKIQGSKGPSVARSKGPSAPWGSRSKGPMVQGSRSRGPRVQGSKGPKVQGSRSQGSKSQRSRVQDPTIKIQRLRSTEGWEAERTKNMDGRRVPNCFRVHFRR